MRWFRARAAHIAAVTMVWMALVGGSAVVPHDDDSHDTYAARPIAHDASAHRVEAASSDADKHPLHCVVCHWVRSFRPHAETRVTAVASENASVGLPLQLFAISAAAPVSQPPLRSPPSSPAA